MTTGPKDSNAEGRPEAGENAATQAVGIAGEVFENTGSALILITEDKLRLALTAYGDALTGRDWVGPLGILLAIVAALVSFSDFRGTRLGLTDHTWHTIFVIAAILAAAWLCWIVVKRLRSGGPEKSLNACVDDIKGRNTERQPRLGR